MLAQRLGLALILAVVLLVLYLFFTRDRVANSPEIETDGMNGFRAFASEIATAVDRKDATFFAQKATLLQFTCEGTLAFNNCDRSPDQPKIVSVIGGTDGGYLYTRAEYSEHLLTWLEAALPRASDALGPGQAVLFGIAERVDRSHGDMFPPTTSYVAVLTAIVASPSLPSPPRQAIYLYFDFHGGAWQLQREIYQRCCAEIILAREQVEDFKLERWR